MPINFIGKIASVINFKVTTNYGPTGKIAVIFTNNTLLNASKTYLVTAEIYFERVGLGPDSRIVSFSSSNQITNPIEDMRLNYIGVPFRVAYWDDKLVENSGGYIKGSVRSNAQAVISNGQIHLVADHYTDDNTTYTIIISAIECDSQSLFPYTIL